MFVDAGASVALNETTTVTGNTATAAGGAEGGGVWVDTGGAGGNLTVAPTASVISNLPDQCFGTTAC